MINILKYKYLKILNMFCTFKYDNKLSKYSYLLSQGHNIHSFFNTGLHVLFVTNVKLFKKKGNMWNKMPTRCNRWFLYCRSYCLLNMFRGTTVPIIRSSRVLYGWAQWCPKHAEQAIRAVGCVSSLWDAARHPANRTHNPQLYTRPTTWKPKHEIPQAATTVQYSWAPDDGHGGARNMLSKQ